MLIPGPVEVPASVLRASAYVVNHRSDEFRNIVRKCEVMLNRFADASFSVITTGSGTTAVESMISSLTKRNETVVAFTFGEFGNRLIKSLHRRGLKVHEISRGPDGIISAEDAESVATKYKDAEAVFLVHNETGNGTSIRNLKEIAHIIKGQGLRVFVDSVSGFGAMPMMLNEWGIDAMATCSQKGIASVPGLGIVSLGEEVGATLKPSEDIPQYLDLGISLDFFRKGETPFTPSTGSFSALLKALEILNLEGIENRWKRHRANAELLRAGLFNSGSAVIGNPSNFSDSVIAFRPLLPVNDTITALAKSGFVVSKGMGDLSDKIVRVGNLGIVSGSDIIKFLDAYYDVSGIGGLKKRPQLDPVSEISQDLLQ